MASHATRTHVVILVSQALFAGTFTSCREDIDCGDLRERELVCPPTYLDVAGPWPIDVSVEPGRQDDAPRTWIAGGTIQFDFPNSGVAIYSGGARFETTVGSEIRLIEEDVTVAFSHDSLVFP